MDGKGAGEREGMKEDCWQAIIASEEPVTCVGTWEGQSQERGERGREDGRWGRGQVGWLLEECDTYWR